MSTHEERERLIANGEAEFINAPAEDLPEEPESEGEVEAEVEATEQENG